MSLREIAGAFGLGLYASAAIGCVRRRVAQERPASFFSWRPETQPASFPADRPHR